MEFIEGGQVNDRDYMKKHDINVNEVTELLSVHVCWITFNGTSKHFVQSQEKQLKAGLDSA